MNPILRRLQRIEWQSPERFSLDGLAYFADMTFKARTTPDEVVVLKPPGYFEAYADAIGTRPTAEILELGIFQGGSTLAFTSILAPGKIVAVDIVPMRRNVMAARGRHPRKHRIKLVWETSQDDEAAISSLIASEFPKGLDLVIDDACHFYAETKRAFEIAFPALRPGGIYAIEDWSWAHLEKFNNLWRDKPALSNLILDLMMASASRPDLIAEVRVFPGVAFVRKGEARDEKFALDDLCYMQGRDRVLL